MTRVIEWLISLLIVVALFVAIVVLQRTARYYDQDAERAVL